MSKHLARDLELVHRKILTLAARVEQSITQSNHALHHRDIVLAQHVIDQDTQIDDLQNQVYEECLKVIALHQPVASDLRRIATVFLICTDLERMGDLAADICERAITLPSEAFDPIPDRMQTMTQLVAKMVRDSLDAFVHLDSALARRVIVTDEAVDEHHQAIADELGDRLYRDPGLIRPGLALHATAEYLERIGDHATNIAESVIYLVDAEVVRHRVLQPPELNQTSSGPPKSELPSD